MARRDTALYALEADPVRNRNWRRFIDPPQRKNPGASTPGQIFVSTINGIKDTAPRTKAQARALAEALFAPGGVT